MTELIGDVSSGLAGWLLTYAVHSTLLLAGAWLLQIRVRSSAVQELLWKGAFVGGLLTTTAQLALVGALQGAQPIAGRWELVRPAALATLPHTNSVEHTGDAFHPGEALLPELAGTAERHAHAEQSGPTERARDAGRLSSATTGMTQPATSRGVDWQLLLCVFWLAGTIIALLRQARRQVRALDRFGDRRQAGDPELLELANDVFARAGIARRAKLTITQNAVSPVALSGNEVCLPAPLLSRLSPAQTESMLLHEAAHVVRRDPDWLLAFGYIGALLFFQPLNTLARRRFQRAAEFLCDDWAVRHTASPLALAQCLTTVASLFRDVRQPVAFAGMAESHSALVLRVQRLLDQRPVAERPRVLSVAALLATLVLFGFVAPVVTSGPSRGSAGNDGSALMDQQQSIRATVAKLSSGVVRFTYDPRPTICGTGEEPDGTRMFALRPGDGWWPAYGADLMALYVWDRGNLMRNDVGVDGNWTRPCLPGPARVDLNVRDGEVVGMEISVGTPAPEVAGRLENLGRVSLLEAVPFLKSLAADATGILSLRALLAAMIAKDGLDADALRPFAQHASSATRDAANAWIHTFTGSTTRAIPARGSAPQNARTLLPDLTQQNADARIPPELLALVSLPVPFDTRMEALRAAERKGVTVAQMLAIYDRVPDRAMRVELIDWLSQRETAAVTAKLLRIVAEAAVLEEQQAALRALTRSRDADAREKTNAYMRKHSRNAPDEFVDARLYNYTYAGAPESTLERRVANVRDGVVLLRYPARPEGCGSGIDADGAGMYALLPTERWRPALSPGVAAFYSFDADDFTKLGLSANASWTPKCLKGDVTLALDVRDGRVGRLRMTVGGPALQPAGATDLGRVPGPEAAAFLLGLARSAGQDVADHALIGAVFADGEPLLYPELLEIATDLSRPERVRQSAVNWVVADPTPGARQALLKVADMLPNKR